ncbi:MAG: ATP-binding protein [Promethearchaeota archaeon]
MPEYINNPKKERLEEYFENIILKDIVERYNIRNTKLIKDLGIYLLSNATNLISHGSLSKVFDVSINTIKEYISFLESAYLFFRLNKFSYSYKKQFKTSSKIYSIDNGLINLVSFKFSENKGRLFENLVFLELKRNNKEIYYHKIKKECDFIIKKNLKITNAIQVSISLDLLKNKKREYEGLIEALNEYNLKEGLIITEDQYEDLKINGFKIKIRPLWFWLLNKTE